MTQISTVTNNVIVIKTVKGVRTAEIITMSPGAVNM